MTIHTNRWSPDTCSNPPCVIEYVWDDAVPDASRTHTISNIVSKCSSHSSLPTKEDVWNVLLEENPRKNKSIQDILDNVPSTFFDLDTDGVTRKFKRNISVNFSFNGTIPNRVLTLTVTGATLTTNQKNTIQTFLNNRFTPGKVVLVNG